MNCWIRASKNLKKEKSRFCLVLSFSSTARQKTNLKYLYITKFDFKLRWIIYVAKLVFYIALDRLYIAAVYIKPK